MSSSHIENIICPKCKETGDHTLWDSVNTLLDPGVKKKVFSGELFTLTCEKCGFTGRVMNPLLYHQQEDKVMIYYVPNNSPDAENYLAAAAGELGGDYRLRIVKSENDLREKIIIFSEKLDDRVVELMKPVTVKIIRQKDDTFRPTAVYLNKKDADTLCFTVQLADGQEGVVDFSGQLYENLENSFANELRTDDSMRIDINWAAEMFRKKEV